MKPAEGHKSKCIKERVEPLKQEATDQDEKLQRIQEMASAVQAALEEKKALDIEVLKVTEKTSLADIFILASGSSGVHLKTLADFVEEKLEEDFRVQASHVEGLENRNWILLDYGDLVVHLMMPEDRHYYQLENLWRSGGDRQTI